MTVRGWGVVAAVAGAAMVLGGCGAGSGAEGDPKATGRQPEMPFDRYELSHRDHLRIADAGDRLAQRCMVGFGFKDFPLRPKPPGGEASALIAMAWSPLGSLDLDHVRRWGYGADPKARFGKAHDGRAATNEEYQILYGLGPDDRRGGFKVRGRVVPEGGCANTHEKVYRGVDDVEHVTTYTAEREAVLEKQTARDPRLREAFRTWSKCVEDKGFKRYARPDAAARDKAWQRGKSGADTSPGKRELGTAVADIECKREHGTADVWWTVLAEKQRADIRKHRAEYEKAERGRDVVRANVRRVLGTA
ncbi:hypothetical protein P8605_08385 [Streptomyces sp. T-3]|nr:hypothetical protein [Streptomyces sp. T-3]